MLDFGLAKGKRVDKRADVWAFGAVVYEMLTGRKAFEGEDVSDTLAAVLRAEPDLAALPADASPALRAALARCLEKDLKRRLRDVGDVRLAMEGAFAAAVPPPVASGSRWRWLPYVLALVTGLAVWGVMRARPAPPRPVARFVVTGAPSPSFFAPGEQHQLALSPDGAWLGFLDGRVLKKIPASGGTAVTIAELSSGVRGASWGDDGTIGLCHHPRPLSGLRGGRGAWDFAGADSGVERGFPVAGASSGR